ncbi:MAG: hypothetical protein HOD72_05085 [Opitutae bacterium]|jgi:hypothetical protein|nr:hypothetical protein [Opitutae bacterium]MBT4223824.1 hypothetical protein [Opitutae bacterium]MBT5689501.1 hypothetical protein [Opitutae bacterium]MBT6460932.1 hypothetical protein [Opitutae bacterium]MBT6957883.1 hypothetical protein [Opitutae bacterium]
MKNILIPFLLLAILLASFWEHALSASIVLNDSAKKFLSDYREDIRQSDPKNLHLHMSDFELFKDLGRVMEEKNAWEYYEQAYPGLKAAYSGTLSHDTSPASAHKASQGHDASKYNKPHHASPDNNHEPVQTQDADKNFFGRWIWIIIGGLAGTILAAGVILLIIINQSMKSKGAKSKRGT